MYTYIVSPAREGQERQGRIPEITRPAACIAAIATEYAQLPQEHATRCSDKRFPTDINGRLESIRLVANDCKGYQHAQDQDAPARALAEPFRTVRRRGLISGVGQTRYATNCAKHDQNDDPHGVISSKRALCLAGVLFTIQRIMSTTLRQIQASGPSGRSCGTWARIASRL